MINAIYGLCNNPDILCGEIIKQKTIFVFKLDDDGFRDEPSASEPVTVNTTQLSQLLFIVGHVTLKQLVHLETIEAEWKRRKQSGETKGADYRFQYLNKNAVALTLIDNLLVIEMTC